MPRPSKYDDSLWLSIYEELEKASDGNEGDEISTNMLKRLEQSLEESKRGLQDGRGIEEPRVIQNI